MEPLLGRPLSFEESLCTCDVCLRGEGECHFRGPESESDGRVRPRFSTKKT